MVGQVLTRVGSSASGRGQSLMGLTRDKQHLLYVCVPSNKAEGQWCGITDLPVLEFS